MIRIRSRIHPPFRQQSRDSSPQNAGKAALQRRVQTLESFEFGLASPRSTLSTCGTALRQARANIQATATGERSYPRADGPGL